jgi:hypothetical protein
MLCLSGYAGEDDLGRSVYKRDWKVRSVIIGALSWLDLSQRVNGQDLAFIAYYTIFFSL